MLDTPLALYIHIPWCVKKCPYCDFNSHENQTALPENRYIDALIADIQQQPNEVRCREVISIFIGGGTPSLFSANGIERLLSAIDQQLSLSSKIEITIEANPGTYDQNNFAGFLAAGINRISIGVQSFSNTSLHYLGRIHNAQTAKDAVQTAKNVGFENINIDLMYALPKQTLRNAALDIQQAIALEPSHISYYQLTLEPNTRFYQHPPELPTENVSWDMQQQGVNLLTKYDYQQYEISAYAQPNKQCMHNYNYWQFGDYIGIGAGAHQKISYRKSNIIIRSEKARHPQQYMCHMFNKEANITKQTLRQEDIQFEFLLNALRLQNGFKQNQYENHTGLEFQALLSRLEPLQQEGLLLFKKDSIRCTNQGFRFLDELLQRLLPEPVSNTSHL